MNKILQIIPADGLYAKIRDDEYDYEFGDDERFDYYSVVCLALMETERGQEIHPLVVHTDIVSKNSLWDAAESKCYAGMTFYSGRDDDDEESDSVTIIQQDGTGFVTMPKNKMLIRVQHKLDPDETVPARISCIVDGRDITLGLYSNDDAADFAYHKLVGDIGLGDKVYMPDSQEIDAERAKEKRHEEYLSARRKDSDINTTFTEKTAEVLIKTAKCYTLNDLEDMTKDEMMEKISKGVRRRRPETCEYVINELQEKGYLWSNIATDEP